MSQRKVKKLNFIFLLMPLVVAFAVAQDIYISSMPLVTKYFHVSPGVTQWTISIFFLTTGIGQLFMGPLSDSYGRRRIILISVLFFFIGSILCFVSPNPISLIISRGIEGLGACGMMVCAFSTVRDIFTGNEIGEVSSWLNSTIAFSPVIAPIIGGYLAFWYGWRANFIFLSIISAIILVIIIWRLKETHSKSNRVPFDNGVWGRYLKVLKNKTAMIYILCGSCALASFLTGFAVAPYLVENLMHKPETQFGYYWAIFGICYFLGCALGSRLVKIFGFLKCTFVGIIITIISGVLLLIMHYLVGLNNVGLIPVLIYAVGGAIIFGSIPGGVLEPFGEIAGYAAALMGCCEFVAAFFVPLIVTQFRIASTIPLSLTYIILGCISLIACIYLSLSKK